MKLDINLTDSFNYTKLLFSDLGRLVVLAILDVIPIVNFIVLGYLGNIMKQPRDSKQLPPLDNYTDLWIQGLKMFIAAVIVMIIPLVLAAPILFTLVLSQVGLAGAFGPTFPLIVVLPLFYIGLALSFFVACLLAMGIVKMVRENDIGKVFAFNEILGVIGRIGWGGYILWLAVLFICSIVVSAVMGNIPFIGWILGLLIAPIIGIFIARSASLVYLEGTAQETAKTTEQT